MSEEMETICDWCGEISEHCEDYEGGMICPECLMEES